MGGERGSLGKSVLPRASMITGEFLNPDQVRQSRRAPGRARVRNRGGRAPPRG